MFLTPIPPRKNSEEVDNNKYLQICASREHKLHHQTDNIKTENVQTLSNAQNR